MHRVLEVANVDNPHQHADDCDALQQVSRSLSRGPPCRETLYIARADVTAGVGGADEPAELANWRVLQQGSRPVSMKVRDGSRRVSTRQAATLPATLGYRSLHAAVCGL